MPFVYDPNLDDEEKQKDPSQVQISGAAPTVNSSSSGQKQGPQATQNTGSGFQNLDKYLQGNQGQDLGNQVAGKIQGQVDQAKTNIDSAAGAFTDKVKTSNSLPNQEAVNSAIANPTGTDASQFQKWENQTYSGPHSLAEDQEDYNKLWSGTNQANTQAQLLGTEPGRFSLLDSYFGKPTYNFGQKSLDNLLIQQGQGIGEKTKDLQDQAAQLKTYGNNQTKALQNTAATQSGAVDQNRQMVRNSIGLDDQGSVITDPNAAGYGAIGRQYSQINDAVAAQNASRASDYQTLLGDIQKGNVSNAELSTLGLSRNTPIYNLDPSSYLAKGADLTANQVMTPEQQAYIQALSKMAGVTDTFAANPLASATPEYGFDSNQFNADQAAAQAGFNNEYEALKTHNALSSGEFTAPSDYQIGGTYGGGSAGADLANLQDDIAYREAHNAQGGQEAYLDTNKKALAALQALMSKYGMDSSGNFNTLNSNARGPITSVYGRGPQVRPG